MSDARTVKQPVASVVITTYRRPVMLKQLLCALSLQVADRSVEVVIIDNCPEATARPVVESFGTAAFRYTHEERRGVVHARNRGVALARGTYIIFLDDDEVPASGWLDAWLSQADGDLDASFGRIKPRLLGPCPPEILPQVERNFSREMRRPHGADITDKSAYLGTGNAMFHKGRCLGADNPFDLRFNGRGGEDVWLIRKLVQRGYKLHWNQLALVEELVPVDRMDLALLRRRRFNQGQLRCILAYGDGGMIGLARAGFWMTVGALQLFSFGTAAALAALFFPRRRADLLCRSSGGAGKLAWWQDAPMSAYGAS